jgi:hypothetical protein
MNLGTSLEILTWPNDPRNFEILGELNAADWNAR